MYKNFLIIALSLALIPQAVHAGKSKISKKLTCVSDETGTSVFKKRKELSSEEAQAEGNKIQSKIDKLNEKLANKDSDKLNRKISKLQAQINLLNDCLNPVTDDNFSIGSIPSDRHKAFSKTFTKHISVFGVSIFATADTPDGKVLHAANILAEYLDNDEDGTVDNQDVVNKLIEKKAAMTLYSTDESKDIGKFFGSLGIEDEEDFSEEELEKIVVVQDLFGTEIFPNSAAFSDDGTEPFDGSIEEILHLITHAGYDDVYPDVFAEVQGSQLANAMEAAKTAGHYDPLSQEPDMPFADQNTEYLYWAITSVLGAQDYSGRLDEIGIEWQLSTSDLVQAQDPTIYALITDPQYKFPTRLPDGDYNAAPSLLK